MKEKIAIGLSGGVDSAVAAWLLKQEGYEVIGLTMETGGPSVAEEAAAVAKQLDIRHEIVDVSEIFLREVVNPFVSEYLKGRTPNPCIECNPSIKWQALMEAGERAGAALFATGHYADVIRLDSGRYTVKMCDCRKKDQTYVLYRLSQEQLARTRMPLARYDKGKIREIAREQNLLVADKPDSMEICFIPDNDYCGFIEKKCIERGEKYPPEGNFVSVRGEVLGKHKGIHHYTVGQRKGLGIALGYPAFVCGIIPETNTVVLGNGEDVMSDCVEVDRVNWMGIAPLKPGQEEAVTARIRYHHKGAKAVLRRAENGRIRCVFDEPQRAVTPGQALVLYRDGWVAAGGRIVGAHRLNETG